MKTKTVSILLMAAMALSLAACGFSNSTDSSSKSSSKAESTSASSASSEAESASSAKSTADGEVFDDTTVTVFAAKSLNSVMETLISEYNKTQPNVKLVGSYDSSGTLMTQIEEGASCDVFFSAAAKQMDQLEEENLLVEGTRHNIVNNQVCVVTYEGNNTEVTGLEDLNKASSIALADGSVPVGKYTREALVNAGILEKADDFDIAVHDLIKKYLTEHQRIIFNGNGYSEEWVEEAARRGLPNIKSMVEASETLTTEKSIKLFEKFGIFTKAELESREEVLYETYSKTINIEALTMVDMAKKQYIPAVMEYTRTLADTVLAVKSAGADATVQTTVLKSISEKLAEAQAAETALEDKLAEAAGIEDPKKLAFFYKDVVHTAMDDLRTPVDELEMMVDKKVWPVPTYGDLIFEV